MIRVVVCLNPGRNLCQNFSGHFALRGKIWRPLRGFLPPSFCHHLSAIIIRTEYLTFAVFSSESSEQLCIKEKDNPYFCNKFILETFPLCYALDIKNGLGHGTMLQIKTLPSCSFLHSLRFCTSALMNSFQVSSLFISFKNIGMKWFGKIRFVRYIRLRMESSVGVTLVNVLVIVLLFVSRLSRC